MTDILLIVVILLLVYLIFFMRKQTGPEKAEAKISYKKVLPEYLHKTCEIYVKESMPSIDVMLSVKGVLLDIDDEWLLLEMETRKKKSLKLFRIDNVNSIKEIK